MTPREYKLVFTGSMGAGKTAAIRAVSDIAPVTTEVNNNDTRHHHKATTTVALDYGEVSLAGGDKLRLFGTPGQSRFDFMWKILGQGALGIVVLVDNSRPDPLADFRTYLDAFSVEARSARVVVGVGRSHSHPSPSLDDYHAAARELGMALPIVSVDVRQRDDVLLLLNILFHHIEILDDAGLPFTNVAG